MKTPEEIKKGLELCSIGDMRECMQCPYPIGFECFEQPMKDALAYIQRLESRLAQVERERDALMYDYPIGMECHTCKHEKTDSLEYPCKDCIETTRSCYILRWEWRGVCPENSKEE